MTFLFLCRVSSIRIHCAFLNESKNQHKQISSRLPLMFSFYSHNCTFVSVAYALMHLTITARAQAQAQAKVRNYYYKRKG